MYTDALHANTVHKLETSLCAKQSKQMQLLQQSIVQALHESHAQLGMQTRGKPNVKSRVCS